MGTILVPTKEKTPRHNPGAETGKIKGNPKGNWGGGTEICQTGNRGKNKISPQ